MKIHDIINLIGGTVVEGKQFLDKEITHVFASDLMSDVLTLNTDESLLLVTGLANLQTIRTCEMSDIKTVIFVRGKKTSAEMRELAAENEMILIETPYSMYRTSGLLFQAGVLSLY